MIAECPPVPETPRQVYEREHGVMELFIYRAISGDVIRARVLKRGRSGWDNVEFADGTRKNIMRGDHWAPCPIEACEVAVEEACRRFIKYDGEYRVQMFKELKAAIDLLENFDPAVFDSRDSHCNSGDHEEAAKTIESDYSDSRDL